ncbi:hypothetical protein GJ629_04735 [Halapricum sp. CBA1109]|uniref:hypothetical protein n=1 Tax=Halapricum sp. CBA1109 TaxID=2668068 RepID=UPI0012F8759F|nr:hypothetical protein [Halapricum sp. CBA1109]MUV89290.1 hypothetical protein [Halapricum sp. CBA1109]
MSTNPSTTQQYRTQTTPETPGTAPATNRPTAGRSTDGRVTTAAPRTFEPSSTGTMPPMFDPTAEYNER